MHHELPVAHGPASDGPSGRLCDSGRLIGGAVCGSQTANLILGSPKESRVGTNLQTPQVNQLFRRWKELHNVGYQKLLALGPRAVSERSVDALEPVVFDESKGLMRQDARSDKFLIKLP